MTQKIIEQIAVKIAIVGGLGLLPKAPGTWGSLGAALAGYYLLSLHDPMYLRGALLISILLGVWSANIYEAVSGKHDQSEVVIDEVAGMWVALLPFNFITLGFGIAYDVAIAFIFFRFFDIMKPFPIGWLDKNITGGLGVMLDDIAAGIATGAAVILVYSIVI